MARDFYIYEHWRPDKDACFYVGKGCGDRAYRIRRRNKHHTAIVASLRKNGLSVCVRIIYSGLREKDALDMEVKRILHWKNSGVQIVNVTNGGEGTSGFFHSVKSREKMSKAKIGLPGRKTMLGRFHSEATREKMSLSHRGKEKSLETRAKLSASLKGKLSNRKSRKKNPETGRKISAALLGRKLSDDHRKKLSVARRKRPFPSLETRLKLSEAAKRRWRKDQGASL